MRGAIRINTDRGFLSINPHQLVWTDRGPRTPSEMDEALTDDYSGTKIEGKLNIRKLTESTLGCKPTVSSADAYALGIFTRRVWDKNDNLIIRIPPDFSDDQINSLARHLRKSRYIKNSRTQIVESEQWKWFRLNADTSSVSAIGQWNLIKTVPIEVRTSGFEAIQAYVKGCLDIRLVDDCARFGFEEERIASLCCVILPLMLKEFQLAPRPLYSPSEYHIDLTKIGDGRVRSTVPRDEVCVMMEIADRNWDLFANGFLLRPS
jgi:hypothetical protein